MCNKKKSFTCSEHRNDVPSLAGHSKAFCFPDTKYTKQHNKY